MASFGMEYLHIFAALPPPKRQMNGKNISAWALLCVLPLCTFCSIEQLPSKIYPPSHKTEPSATKDTVEVLCFSAVRYEEGYDWNKDAEYGLVPCSLLLFVGDSLALNLPVGEAHARASDSDMHHLVGTDLYEDYSTKSETILSKNGVELFRIDSRELIFDLLIKGNYLFTLGEPRSGGGFVLRKNGTIVAQSPNIYPIAKLYEDDGKLLFNGVSTLSSGFRQYYSIENGEAIPMNSEADDVVLMDYRKICGEAAVIVKIPLPLVGAQSLAIYQNLRISLFNPNNSKDHFSGISYGDGDIYFRGFREGKYCIWDKDGKAINGPEAASEEAVVMEGSKLWALLKGEDGAWTIFSPEKAAILLPEGYKPHSSRAMLVHKGKVYLSLVDSEGRAAIWMDGRVVSLGFNGFVDGFSIGRVVRER